MVTGFPSTAKLLQNGWVEVQTWANKPCWINARLVARVTESDKGPACVWFADGTSSELIDGTAQQVAQLLAAACK